MGIPHSNGDDFNCYRRRDGGNHEPLFVREPIDTQRVLAAVANDAAGANVLFVGTARGITDGVLTSGLEYEAHESMAADSLIQLRAEAVSRFSLAACAVVHRLGKIAVGEASIAIAVSGPHRHAAWRAAEWLMEQIKTQTPIWKCEYRPDGQREWSHPGSMPVGCASEEHEP